MITGKHKYGDTLLYITIPNNKQYGENLIQRVDDFRSGWNTRLTVRSESYVPQEIQVEKEDDHYVVKYHSVIRMDEAEYSHLEKVLRHIGNKANREVVSALSHSTSSSALISNEPNI